MRAWVAPSGKLHKLGDDQSHSDFVVENGELFDLSDEKISSYLSNNLSNPYQDSDGLMFEGLNKGWMRVQFDGQFALFHAAKRISNKKLADRIYDFIVTSRLKMPKTCEIGIIKGEETIFEGTYKEFLSSHLFESFNQLVEGFDTSEPWGHAYWYNWKTGKLIDIGMESHWDYVWEHPKTFGLSDDARKSLFDPDARIDFDLLDKYGWVQAHDYQKMLCIFVGKGFSNNKINDIAFDVVKLVSPKRKKLEVHSDIRIFELGFTDAPEWL